MSRVKTLMNSFYRAPFLVPYWSGEEIRTVIKLAAGGKLVQGEHIGRFESELSDFFGVKYSRCFNLGRSALFMGIKGLGLKRGDEVIAPSFACRGVVAPVIRAGCTLVYCDIGKDLNIDVNKIEKSITKKTKAMIVPHLSGKAANISEIGKIAKERDIYLIDDAAQAIGAKHKNRYLGTFGEFGILSTGIGKNMNATVGGELLTNSDRVSSYVESVDLPRERCSDVMKRAARIITEYRYRKRTYPFFILKRYVHAGKRVSGGITSYPVSRISNLDAALGIIQFGKLDQIIKRRRRNAKILCDCLSGTKGLKVPEYSKDHIFTKYTVCFDSDKKSRKGIERWDRLLEFERFMKSKRIEVEWPYIPLHLREGSDRYRGGGLSVTESLWWRLITLPVNPLLNEEDMKHVADSVRLFLRQTS